MPEAPGHVSSDGGTAKAIGGHRLDQEHALTELPLDSIKTVREFQIRTQMSDQLASYYSDRMMAGDLFPPVDVFDKKGSMLLLDGMHRLEASRLAGKKTILARVHVGTKKDALKVAFASNMAHGLHLSNKDKRRAVHIAFQEFPKLSDGAIAEMLKVAQSFVSKHRRQLSSELGSGKRVGRDGKERQLPQKEVVAKFSPPAPASEDHWGDEGLLRLVDCDQYEPGLVDQTSAPATGEGSAPGSGIKAASSVPATDEAGHAAEAGFGTEDVEVALGRIKQLLAAELERCANDRWEAELLTRLGEHLSALKLSRGGASAELEAAA